jgi:outer membrane lipoprotein SlyB
METQEKSRIHPLAAGAAVAVIVASAVGVAAMTGHMPGSNAEVAVAPQAAVAPQVVVAPRPAAPVTFAPSESAEHKAAREQGAREEATRERDRARHQQMAANTQPSHAQAPAGCVNCGVVESVHAVQQNGQGGAVGMVGGGVAGALVGSQIGHGTGKTVAEVAGAAGGAFLGNEIQKKVTATTHYDVAVRMESGSTQTVSYPTQPAFAVGSRVRVENGTLVQN